MHRAVAHPRWSAPHALMALAITWLLAACGGGGASASPGSTTSTATPSQPSGDSAPPSSPAPAATDLCGIFTLDEVAEALGTAAGPGSVSGPLDSGCQWVAEAGDAFLMIQKVPVVYFEEPGSRDVRAVEGIGDYAYTGPHGFGRVATARTAEAGYLVIGPESIDDDVLVALLTSFVERSAAAPTGETGIDLGSGENPPGGEAPAGGEGAEGSDDCPLTDEDVSREMGRPMVPGMNPCSWVAENASAAEAYEVYFYPIALDFLSFIDSTRIEGVGDEAFEEDFGTIYVRVGDRAFQLQVLAMGAGPDFPGSSVASQALARRAADVWR